MMENRGEWDRDLCTCTHSHTWFPGGHRNGFQNRYGTSKGRCSGQGQLLYLLTHVDVEVADELRLLSRYSDTWERQSALIICEEGIEKQDRVWFEYDWMDHAG